MNRYLKVGGKKFDIMHYPKISIITPSFNQGLYIEQTILSVLNQNYPNLEYIIIDGGSSDETVQIIKKYENKIHYWISEKDKGQADAINKGLKKCTGDIISFINSDDIYEKKTFIKVCNKFNEIAEKNIIICGTFKSINETNSVIWQPKNLNDEIKLVEYTVFELLECWRHTLPQPSTFWTKEVFNTVGYFDTKLHFALDLDYWIRAIKSNIKIYRINTVYSNFRRHEHAKSSTHIKILKEDLLYLKSKYLSSFFIKTAYLIKFYIWFYSVSKINEAIISINKGENLKAFKILIKATFYFPLSPLIKINLYAIFFKKLIK